MILLKELRSTGMRCPSSCDSSFAEGVRDQNYDACLPTTPAKARNRNRGGPILYPVVLPVLPAHTSVPLRLHILSSLIHAVRR